MLYWYVVFISPWASGHALIRQVSGNTFNLAAAHEYLLATIGAPVVITKWFDIGERQFDKMTKYLRKVHDIKEDRGPNLTVVTGGSQGAGRETDKTLPAHLRPVPSPKEDPDPPTTA